MTDYSSSLLPLSSSFGTSSAAHHGGEQITLQFGSYSNFVGAHYWNFLDELYGRKALETSDSPCYQERFHHEKLYRSRTEGGHTANYPRALMFDLKGRAGYLHPEAMENAKKPIDERLHGIFGDGSSGSGGYGNVASSNWTGDVKVVQSKPIERNKFFEYLQASSIGSDTLDIGNATETVDSGMDGEEDEYVIDSGDVKSWTDFLQAKLCNDSLMELPNFTSGNLEPFDTFFSGTSNEYIDKRVREDYMDAFRCLMEECDRISNVNVMTDVDDGFSGFVTSFLEELRDELPRTFLPVWAFTDPLQGSGQFGRKAVDPLLGPQYGALSLKSCNVPLFYSKVQPLANIILPIDTSGFDHIAPYNIQCDGSFYHTAAVVAAAMETMMSSNYIKDTREGSNNTNLASVLGGITLNGKCKFVEAEFFFPADLFVQYTVEHNTPGGTLTSFTSSLSSAACGPWAGRTTRGEQISNVYNVGLFSRGLDVEFFRQKTLELQTQSAGQTAFKGHWADPMIVQLNASSTLTPISIPVSYPDFFCNAITSQGMRKTVRPLDASAITACGRSSQMPEHLKKVLRNWNECAKNNSIRTAQWEKVGMPIEERLEISESLEQIILIESDEL